MAANLAWKLDNVHEATTVSTVIVSSVSAVCTVVFCRPSSAHCRPSSMKLARDDTIPPIDNSLAAGWIWAIATAAHCHCHYQCLAPTSNCCCVGGDFAVLVRWPLAAILTVNALFLAIVRRLMRPEIIHRLPPLKNVWRGIFWYFDIPPLAIWRSYITTHKIKLTR